MSATTSRGSASAVQPAEEPPAAEFTVHWGRASVALIGLLALITALITSVLLAVTSLSPVIPMVAAVVFLSSLATLRTMAVLRRRRRRRNDLDSAMREAMNPDVDSAGLRRPSVPSTAATLAGEQAVDHGETSPFDALTSDDHGVGGPRSLQEIDADGLPIDLAETFPVSEDPVTSTAVSPAEPWEPREVPRPKYLEVEKVERPMPGPITPEAPRPTGEVKLGQTSSSPAVAPPAAQPATAQAAVQQSLDLDAVLKRRRA